MKILITGGSGFVGSHTAVELSARGHETVLLDDLSNSTFAALAAVRSLTGRDVPFVRGDIADAALLADLFGAHRFDAVVHCAAVKSVAESVARPLDYYATNVAGTVRLIQAMAAHGVKTLVFSSTAAVYGDAAEVPTPEHAPPAPASPYAGSKLAAERLLGDLCAADPEWRVSILRYFNVAGAHSCGRLGEAPPGGAPRNLLLAAAAVAAGGMPRLTVYGGDYPTRDGTAERDYLHVEDVARAHVLALAALERRGGLGVYNLGSGRGYTVLEAVRALEAASGAAVPVRIAGRRSGDVGVSRAHAGRARRELGWRAVRGLDAICADLWRWRSRAGRAA